MSTKFTFDEICESQNFDHDEEFILASNADDMEKEITALKGREKKLISLVKELCLFKIYDDYKFTTDQNKNYYAQPVIFPLAEFENLNRRAREVLKLLEMGVEL